MQLSESNSIFCDLVRGFAAQLVVCGHAISYFGVLTFLHYPSFPWMQNIAVILFFVLSGFVIQYTLTQKMKNEDYGFYEYFTDRFSRIFSVFLPVLVLIYVIDSLSCRLSPEQYHFSSAFNIPTFIANVFMLQDFPIVHQMIGQYTSFGSARPFWTLAIEWWLYMFFGFFSLIL